MRLNISKVSRKIQFVSFQRKIHNWFPGLYWILARSHIGQRIYISCITKSKLNYIFWLYFIISGRHISRNGFSLSNYGVWLAVRPNDITYNFCLDASYGNRLERILHEVSVSTIFAKVVR